MSDTHILTDRSDPRIWRVTFNRPEARNAMTFPMYDRLAQLARDASGDDALRAIVFRGAGGKAFVSGTDIAQFREFKTDADALDYEQRISTVIDALARIRVPTIAAIDGSCVGGGFGIAAACDLRIATPHSRFGFPIAKGLGNCLSPTSLYGLVSLAGVARAKELIFTARLVEAAEAQAMGLIHEVTAGDAFEARVEELAQMVASYAPLTLRATKEMLRRMRERMIPEGSDLMTMCYGSADFKEGVAAFLEKRAPRWQGR
jgi:enoyl-CoA hydratase/carnithine racemase